MEGLKIAGGWANGHLLFNLPAAHFFYYAYNALVYYLFGFYPSVVRIFNCFFGVFTGINVYFISRKMFGDTTAKIAAFLTIFFPSTLFQQTMNMKEALVTFLLTLIIKKLIDLKNQYEIKSFIIAIVSVFLLITTRDYAGIFMGFVVCAYFLFTVKISPLKKIVIFLIIFAMVGLISYKIGLGPFGIDYIKKYNLAYIDHLRKGEYQGGSEVLQDMSISTIPGLLKFIPIAFLYFMFSPFPWQLTGSLIQFFSSMENIIWYVLFAFFPSGIWAAFKKEKRINTVLVTVLLGFTSLYTLQMANMGLANRMKGQLLPIFFIFIALGIAQFHKKMLHRIQSHARDTSKSGEN
ncbi:MAG: glycosyltransferase family 39 protein [Clostridiales bacterium]|nr:glycosyltransferase family 39 protein [Eubacteriales bacterium]MDH7565700.1 glycosyltransferase family 39 protein [Clostridiales bacterium]